MAGSRQVKPLHDESYKSASTWLTLPALEVPRRGADDVARTVYLQKAHAAFFGRGKQSLLRELHGSCIAVPHADRHNLADNIVVAHLPAGVFALLDGDGHDGKKRHENNGRLLSHDVAGSRPHGDRDLGARPAYRHVHDAH